MTYDVGFIGYGMMGRAHANALARLPMFFPEAPATNRKLLCGRDEQSLEAAADRLGFDATTTDWREVVESVDVLYNLGPNSLHAEPSIAALERDVHVLCEKPLAATLEEADRMVEAAERSAATAGCAFNYRFVPALARIEELVATGTLGEIRRFRGQYLQDFQADADDPWIWRNDADVAGYGRVGDVGAHTLDLARWLVGDVDRVAGHRSRFVDERPDPETGEARPVTTEDAYGALLEFATGAQGVVEGSRVATGHTNTNAIELIGSKGAVRFDVERLNEFEFRGPDDRGFQRVLVTADSDPWMDAWWPDGHTIGWEHTVVHENVAFLRAVEGGPAFAPDFRDAFAVQEVMEAVVASDEAGSWVTV